MSHWACIMTDFLSRLPPCWTAIAERPRESTTARLHWHEVAGAPLSPMEARRLAVSDAILMAQRYFPDHVELLIRSTMQACRVTCGAADEPAWPKTTSSKSSRHTG